MLVTGKKPAKKGEPRNCHILAFPLNIFLQWTSFIYRLLCCQMNFYISIYSSMSLKILSHSKYFLMKRGQCSFLRGKQMLFKQLKTHFICWYHVCTTRQCLEGTSFLALVIAFYLERFFVKT